MGPPLSVYVHAYAGVSFNLCSVLFQGPPGTGKTKTILGILSVLLSTQVNGVDCSRKYSRTYSRTNSRILVESRVERIVDRIVENIVESKVESIV